MASPNNTQPPPTQPISPPTEPPTTNHAAGGPTAAATTTTAANGQPAPSQPTLIPATSLKDSGKSRRPRDVRLMHMLLASLGVSAYQERVPLQLLDFAYRYTSNILQDAVHLATEGYAAEPAGGGPGAGAGAGAGAGGGNRGGTEVNNVTLSAVRLSIASRLHYQFQTGLPKEFLMDVASERNRIALPGAVRGYDVTGNRAPQAANQSVLLGGMRLPPERFILTGTGWTMREEWESEGEEEVGEDVDMECEAKEGGETAGAPEVKEEEGGEDEDAEDGKMEDVFGEDTNMGMGEGEGDEDEDKDMADA